MEQRKHTEPIEAPQEPLLGATASTEVAGVIKGIRVKAGIPGAGAQNTADLLTYMDIPWEVRDPRKAEPISWLVEAAA